MKELREYGIEPLIADLIADASEAKRLYGGEFVDQSSVKNMDAAILTVSHTEISQFTTSDIDKFFGEGRKTFLDIKGVLNREEYEKAGYLYWRL